MGLRSPSLRLAGLRLSESVTVVYDSQRGDGFLLAVKCFRNGAGGTASKRLRLASPSAKLPKIIAAHGNKP
jgi:hypothetical protein